MCFHNIFWFPFQYVTERYITSNTYFCSKSISSEYTLILQMSKFHNIWFSIYIMSQKKRKRDTRLINLLIDAICLDTVDRRNIFCSSIMRLCRHQCQAGDWTIRVTNRQLITINQHNCLQIAPSMWLAVEKKNHSKVTIASWHLPRTCRFLLARFQ